jgi:hypothetical protein
LLERREVDVRLQEGERFSGLLYLDKPAYGLFLTVLYGRQDVESLKRLHQGEDLSVLSYWNNK